MAISKLYKGLIGDNPQKVKWNADKSKGKIRFQMMGAPEYRSKLMDPETAVRTAHRIAEDIRQFEEVSTDPNKLTKGFPFTQWQLREIKNNGHTLLPIMRKLFTNSLTFGEVYEMWIADKKSAGNYKGHIRSLSIYDTDIDDITEKGIADLFEDMHNLTSRKSKGQSLGLDTIAQIQGNVITVFNYALSNGHLTQNIIKDCALIKEVTEKNEAGKNRHYFNFDQQAILRFIAVRRDAAGPETWRSHFNQNALLVELDLETGARSSDLQNAKWSEFKNLGNDNCEWTFRQRKHSNQPGWTDSKKGKKWDITHAGLAYHSTLIALLREAYANRKSEYVFEKMDGSRITPRYLGEQFSFIVNDANQFVSTTYDATEKEYEPIVGTLHKMRHTMVSNCITHTGNWILAARKCGHANANITLENYGAMMDTGIDELNKVMIKANAERAAQAVKDLAAFNVDISTPRHLAVV